MNPGFSEPFFAVLDDGGKLGKRHELKWFGAVFFLSRPGGRAISHSPRVRLFPDQFFSDEVSGTFGTVAICRLKDDAISQIQQGYIGFLLGSERRNKGEFGLSGQNRSGVRLTDNVDISV